MEEKLRFVFDYERDEESMTDLCQRNGTADGQWIEAAEPKVSGMCPKSQGCPRPYINRQPQIEALHVSDASA